MQERDVSQGTRDGAPVQDAKSKALGSPGDRSLTSWLKWTRSAWLTSGLAVALAVSLGFHLFGGASTQRAAGPRVASFQVSGRSTRPTLLVDFDRPMVNPAALAQPLAEGLVVLEPAMALDARFLTPRRLQVRPRAALPAFANYQLCFGQAFADVEGRPVSLDSPHVNELSSLSFVSGTPRLREDPTPHIEYSGAVVCDLALNGPVRQMALKQHLQLEDAQGEALTYRLSGAQRDWQLHLQTLPKGGATLTLRAGLTTRLGPVALPADERYHLQWDEKLRVTSADASLEGARGEIVLDLSHDPMSENLSAFVSVDPAPADLRVVARGAAVVLAGSFPPRRRVQVHLRKGLPAANGVRLEQDVHRTLLVPAPAASVKFLQAGRVLSAAARPELEIEGVNLQAVEVEIKEVYPSNLVPLALRWESAGGLASKARVRRVSVAGVLDVPWKERLDLESIWGAKPRGVYHITVRDPEDHWTSDRRLLQITDLAPLVRAGPDGLVVFVTRLSDGALVADAEVQVFDRKNQVLARGHTDKDGLFLSRGAPVGAFVVTARTEDDLAYVDMRRHGLSHRARDIEGRLAARTLEAFVWSDRGVLRPGEVAHLGALVRTPAGAAPSEGLPLALELRAPDGRILRTWQRRTDAHGMVALDVPFALDAPLGGHVLAVHAPGSKDAGGDKKPIGQVGFRVDSVVPDRIEPYLELPEGPLVAGAALQIALGAKDLSGVPAAGLQAKLKVRYTAAPDTSPQAGFVFGDAEVAPKPRVETVATLQLDDNGQATAELTLPKSGASALALQAAFELEVIDVSGRAAFVRESRPLPVTGPRLGIAPPSDTGFSVQVALEGGERVTGEATLERLEWRGAYVLEGRRRVWRAEKTGHLLERVAFDLSDGVTRLGFSDPGNGSFRVSVKAPDCHGAALVFERWGGETHAARQDAGAPNLPLRLLGGHATPGEMALLEVDAPFSGRALLTLEGPTVFEARIVELVRGMQRLEIQVPDAPAPNLHASLTLTRGLRDQEGGAARVLGAVNVPLRRPDQHLEVVLDVPAEALPGTEVRVGLTTSASATVRLHLVDEGMLRLTGHRSPRPAAFFDATRRLETRLADVYTGLLERMRFGGEDPDPGGGGLGALGVRLDPTARKTIETIALASQLVTCEGELTVPFQLPENFEGRLRLFAVAASAEATGHAATPLLVKAPVSVVLHTPRAVAPGDEFDVVIQTRGNEVEWSLTLDGLERLQEAGERVRLRALDRPGVATVLVTARDVDGNVTRRRAALSIRPAAAFTVQHAVRTLAAGEVLDEALPGGLLEGHRRATVTVGGDRALELLPALERLLEYPHGCVEQTTSRAFPVLAWSELARAAHPDGGAPVDTVRAAIDRLLSMQTSDGGLGYWPGARESNLFSSTYAAHFLVEASRLGRVVPKAPLTALLDYLEARVREGAFSAYALRVLAAGGRSIAGHLPAHLDQAKTAEARAHLAAALLLSGEGERAGALLADCGDPWAAPRLIDGSLTSPVRAASTVLGALVEVQPDDARIEALALRLRSAARAAATQTTQENAAALLALAKYHRMKHRTPVELNGVLTLGGRRLAFNGGSARRFVLADGEPWRLGLRATARMTFVVRTEGIPLTPEEGTLERGMQIKRTIEGVSGPLRQGRVYRVVIEGTLPEGAANVLVTDILPGGLEIEAARDQEGTLKPDRVEPRDDRVLFFRSEAMKGAFRQTYLVRAVTPGVFQQPAVEGELLYAPEIRARSSGGGTLEIVR